MVLVMDTYMVRLTFWRVLSWEAASSQTARARGTGCLKFLISAQSMVLTPRVLLEDSCKGGMVEDEISSPPPP